MKYQVRGANGVLLKSLDTKDELAKFLGVLKDIINVTVYEVNKIYTDSEILNLLHDLSGYRYFTVGDDIKIYASGHQTFHYELTKDDVIKMYNTIKEK